jgi:prepilin-type N-terminal cleavage/methylation domain-containing protein
MNRRGFTIIELAVVITIMGILLVLSAVNLSGSRLSARDSERQVDIETIALNLETYYQAGTDSSVTTGRYPSTTELIGSEGTLLRDIDMSSLIAPGGIASSLSAAVDATTPQPNINQYIYQPIQSNGTLCTLSSQECRKFNLFYKLESTNSVVLVTSRNQ